MNELEHENKILKRQLASLLDSCRSIRGIPSITCLRVGLQNKEEEIKSILKQNGICLEEL